MYESTTQQVVSDWRGERHEPVDEHAHCNYCNGMRFVVSLKGDLKPCPLCHVALDWKSHKMDAYSSNAGKAKTQSFDNFKPVTPALKNLVAIVRDWAREPRTWLFIHGTPGNGKTHLCAAAYNALASAGAECIFVSMPDLLASLRSLFDEATRNVERDSYQKRLQTYQRAEVLIVDDLGAERQTEWTDGVLFELLDYRYRNKLPTLLSSNLDPRDPDTFDARLISRWHDSEFSMVLKNTAPDFRQRNGNGR